MARLLHQSPSPTAAASSTLAPAASSAVPNKAPSLNHGILNLQILQHGGMQHLLEASQTLSNLTCLNNLILLENLLSLPPFKPPQSSQDFSGDKAPKTEKRIFWTQDEDVRMVSLIAIYGV